MLNMGEFRAFGWKKNTVFFISQSESLGGFDFLFFFFLKVPSDVSIYFTVNVVRRPCYNIEITLLLFF